MNASGNGTSSFIVMASTPNHNISSFQCPITFDFDPINITITKLGTSVVPTWVSLAAINGVTSLPTALINLLVIWTVLENEQLRGNNYYLLVTVLSFSDLLVGLIVQPLCIAMIVGILVQYSRLCELTMFSALAASLSYGWSLLTMVVVSLERYVFIEHPMYYRASVTSKKLMILTAASWAFLGISQVLCRFLVDSYFWARQLVIILTTGSSLVIIVFCVTKINLTARRQMRAIVAQQQPVTQKSKIREYKRTFTLGLIVLASVTFLCPMLIMKIVGAAMGNSSDDFKYVSQAIYFTCLNMQSIVNPIIYSLRLSEIRSGVAKKLFCKRI